MAKFDRMTLLPLIQCLLPFLRCVIIFRQYLDLYNIDYLPAEVLESKTCSFKAICQVLDLSPSLCSFFDADGSRNVYNQPIESLLVYRPSLL